MEWSYDYATQQPISRHGDRTRDVRRACHRAAKGGGKAGSTQTQGETKEQGSSQKGTSQRKAEPKNEQGSAQSNGKDKGAQTKQQSKRRAAQTKESRRKEREQGESKEKSAQTQEKGGKGTAQAPDKEQDKKGSAQTAPREKAGKGAAQAPSKDKVRPKLPAKEQEKMGSGQAQSKDRDGKESAQKQSRTGWQKSSQRSSSGERVQLSEQQRTNVHQTLLKESNLNRASEPQYLNLCRDTHPALGPIGRASRLHYLGRSRLPELSIRRRQRRDLHRRSELL